MPSVAGPASDALLSLSKRSQAHLFWIQFYSPMSHLGRNVWWLTHNSDSIRILRCSVIWDSIENTLHFQDKNQFSSLEYVFWLIYSIYTLRQRLAFLAINVWNRFASNWKHQQWKQQHIHMIWNLDYGKISLTSEHIFIYFLTVFSL